MKLFAAIRENAKTDNVKRDQLDELAASGKENVNSNYTCEASKLRMKIATW